MTSTSVTAGPPAARLTLPARFLGVITAPKETFRAIVAHPAFLGMLLLTTVIIAFCAAMPLTTERGQEAALAQQVKQREGMGMPVDDRQYEALRRTMPFAPYFAAGAVVVMGPVMALIFSGILFAVFNAGMGGEATFKQLFSVVVHAGAISTLGQLFTGPLNYFRGEVTSATNLAVLLPMLDEKSFAGRLAGMVDLFMIWWVLVLAIGLGVLYRRRTQPIAVTLYGVYAAIVIVAAFVMSRLGNS